MGQTAVYGLPTIISRVVNFMLTPLLTAVLDTGSFGVMSVLFVYIGLFLALLTWGMETSVFRFSNKYPNNERVFPTAFLFTAFLGISFFALSTLFAAPGAVWLGYPGHGEYIFYIAIIVSFDVASAVPMAKLRQLNRPFRFSMANLASIILNVALVFFFLIYCRSRYMELGSDAGWIVNNLYNHDIGVGYVFIANIAASALRFLVVLPVAVKGGFKYDSVLLKEMLIYSTPLAVASVCFMINERADVAILKFLLPADEADAQAGVYAAVYKLAIIMNIFIQAFRFAAEPFFFSLEKEKDSKEVYARILNYFTVFCLLIFLTVTLFINEFKLLLRNHEYWAGLHIVPILLMANLFSGVYQNLSMWYKLSGRTLFGMWFSVFGAGLTIGLNFLFIPFFGYEGSAWATLGCYFSMSAISYVIGQRNYFIPYEPLKIGFYILVAVCIYCVNLFIPKYSLVMEILTGLASLAFFIILFIRNEPDIKTIVLRYYAKLKR